MYWTAAARYEVAEPSRLHRCEVGLGRLHRGHAGGEGRLHRDQAGGPGRLHRGTAAPGGLSGMFWGRSWGVLDVFRKCSRGISGLFWR